jgi:hypothetical protein
MLVFAGCGTLDVTSRHTGPAPTCGIHGTVMIPELISTSSGEICYLPHYYRPAREEFPHHGDWVFQGERPYGRTSRHVRDFVCADCTEGFRRYWKERGE